jgi:hypothetical protein
MRSVLTPEECLQRAIDALKSAKSADGDLRKHYLEFAKEVTQLAMELESHAYNSSTDQR